MIGLILAATLSAGDTALKSGNFDDAFTQYQQALKTHPNDANAELGLGTIYLYRNDLPNAKTYLEAAAKLLPDDRRVQGRLHAVTQREAAQTDATTTAVTIPFIATDPLPLVTASVNGTPLTFLLDTGGSGVDVAPDTAKKLGLKLTEAGEGTFAGGLTTKTYESSISTFAVGSATLTNVSVGILPHSFTMAGHHIDGAIGTNFLTHFIATFDYKRGQLVLRPRIAAASVLADATAQSAAVVPMWLVGDHFIFARARVNQAPDALYNIDTGGSGLGVQLTKAELGAAGITVDGTRTASFAGGAGNAKAIPFKANSVTIGSVTKNDMPGLFFPDGDQYQIFPFDVAGTVSHEFFKGSAVTFDFVDMKMIVST